MKRKHIVDYLELIDRMTPELYERLQRAVEVGKWPDGKPVSKEQRAHAMQAIIAWGEKHLVPDDRVGFIDKGENAGESCDDPQPTPLNWK